MIRERRGKKWWVGGTEGKEREMFYFQIFYRKLKNVAHIKQVISLNHYISLYHYHYIFLGYTQKENKSQ